MDYKWIRSFLWENKFVLSTILATFFFFWPIFKGFMPFPADLLVGEYVPYNSNTYFGISPGGVPNKGQGFDVIRMLFPWKEFAVDSLINWQIPLWNPYNFSGTPFLANFQGGFFYPFNLFFLLFPKLDAWTLYIITQPLLASFFTYFFLREHKLSEISSVFGGLAFSFSSYMVVWMEYGNIGHSIIWLPLALFSIEKLIKKKTVMFSLLLVLSLALSILAGYIQTSIYLYIFSFIYMIFRLFQEKKIKVRSVIAMSTLFALPVALSAIQLVPTIELFFYSAREAYSPDMLSKLLVPPIHLVTIFAPDFFGNPATRNYFLEGTYIERVSYVGVIPLLFLLLAIGRNINKIFWFFFISGLAVLMLSFNNPISVFIYSLKIPIISTGVPTRIMYLFGFSAAICSAIGFDIWLRHKNTRFLPQVVFLIGICFLMWFSVLLISNIKNDSQLLQNLLISKRNLILPTLILLGGSTLLIFSRFVKKKNLLAIVFISVLLFEQFYFFNKITPFSPKEFFYPETPILSKLKSLQGIDRMWGFEDAYIQANIQTHEKIFSSEGYDPLFIKRYSELVNSGNSGKIEPVSRSNVVLPSSYGESLRINRFRDVLLDILGVKFILNKNEYLGKKNEHDNFAFPQDEYDLIYQSSPWQIYQNKDVLPRFFLSDSFIIESDYKKIISKLYDNKKDSQTIILEEDPNIQIRRGRKDVKLVDYSPNEVTFLTNSLGDSILFLSDNYYPGWKVLIDDNMDKIYRANYSFRAVKVPEGRHTVKFIYDPESFKIGLLISGVGIIALFVVLLILRKISYEHLKKNEK